MPSCLSRLRANRALMFALSTVSLMTIAAGCADRQVEAVYVPVTAKVTLDGQPLVGAEVRLLPASKMIGSPSFGITDANGVASLKFGGEAFGVLPGSYKVTISKMTLPDGQPIPPEADLSTVQTVAAVPPQYSSPEQSKLTASVGNSTKELTFALTK